MARVRVLFVCLGNICRSPTAHGVFQKFIDQAGLSADISVDSAGTSNWHIDEAPDRRSTEAAGAAGYDISGLRGRQVTRKDFEKFDYILAMDESNLADLEDLCPSSFSGHLGLFLEFARNRNYQEVPDPYHGGEEGFGLVLSLIEDASAGLLKHLKKKYF